MAAIEAIETVYLEADAAVINISSIPSTYEHLMLRWSLSHLGTYSGGWVALAAGYLELAGDTTGNNYRSGFMRGLQSGSSASQFLAFATDSGAPTMSTFPNAQPKQIYGAAVAYILDYSTTNKKTTVIQDRGTTFDDSDYGSTRYLEGGVWNNTPVIDEIELSVSGGVIMRGSTVSLYGMNSS